MPYTIAAAFDALKENLEPTVLQKETLAARQKNVRDAVAAEMNVLEHFLVGSYVRQTMIGPLKEADIDIFMILDPGYLRTNGQSELLNQVKTILLKTYPRTPRINRNGQAVTISFEDFKVDVVPAFNRQGGGYLIPDTNTGKWIATNPKIHEQLVTKENAAQSGRFVPLVKMIKGWNRCVGNKFVGFRLELLLLKKYEKVLIGDDYAKAITSVFNTGREAIRHKAEDPAGYGGEISGLDNASSADDAQRIFQTAFDASLLANQYEMQGQMSLAFSQWKKIFGESFPAYG